MSAEQPLATDGVSSIEEAMTRQVITIEPDASLVLAARRMRDADVRCLPVIERGRLVGMITDRDLVVRGLADELHPSSIRVRDAMSAAPLFCRTDQTTEEVKAIMETNRVKRLPVLDRRRRLVGIVSLGDIAGHGPKCRPRQVTFYKKMTTSSGQLRNVSVSTVYLAPGVQKDQIAATAINRFERDHGVKPWTRLADAFEVTPEDD